MLPDTGGAASACYSGNGDGLTLHRGTPFPIIGSQGPGQPVQQILQYAGKLIVILRAEDPDIWLWLFRLAYIFITLLLESTHSLILFLIAWMAAYIRSAEFALSGRWIGKSMWLR